MAQRLCPGCGSVLVGGPDSAVHNNGTAVCPKDGTVTKVTDQHQGAIEPRRLNSNKK